MQTAVRCLAHEKVMFISKKRAREAADRMVDRDKFAVYRCTSSKAWHIGHNGLFKKRKPLKEIGCEVEANSTGDLLAWDD